jgi:hypothetical protein
VKIKGRSLGALDPSNGEERESFGCSWWGMVKMTVGGDGNM